MMNYEEIKAEILRTVDNVFGCDKHLKAQYTGDESTDTFNETRQYVKGIAMGKTTVYVKLGIITPAEQMKILDAVIAEINNYEE